MVYFHISINVLIDVPTTISRILIHTVFVPHPTHSLSIINVLPYPHVLYSWDGIYGPAAVYHVILAVLLATI
jgi:hypothetical protein